LVGGEEQRREDDAGDDEAMNVDEVPRPRDADGVSVTGCTEQRRDVPRIILGRPQPTLWNGDRRELDPFTARRAVVVEIQPWVVRKNR